MVQIQKTHSSARPYPQSVQQWGPLAMTQVILAPTLKDLDGQIWNYSTFLPSALHGLVFLSYRVTGFKVLSEMQRMAVLPCFCSFSRRIISLQGGEVYFGTWFILSILGEYLRELMLQVPCSTAWWVQGWQRKLLALNGV